MWRALGHQRSGYARRPDYRDLHALEVKSTVDRLFHFHDVLPIIPVQGVLPACVYHSNWKQQRADSILEHERIVLDSRFAAPD